MNISPFAILDSPPELETLTSDYGKLVNNQLFSDVVFVVEGRELHAHRAILVVRAEYFRAMFCDKMKESRSQVCLNIIITLLLKYLCGMTYIETRKHFIQTDVHFICFPTTRITRIMNCINRKHY
jgi:hypothetical protein